VEIVESPLPAVVTVNGSARACRPRNAKLLQKYKHAKTITERQNENIDYIDIYSSRPYLNLTEWSVVDVDADVKQCGLSGSPTKVKKIENVVFQAKESKRLTDNDYDIEELVKELIENHMIG
ncbi:MAG: electron transfer flavoprotein beta subunit, partial [Bacteroidota bacterium]|nr:electron transfer flavoprotein beta subunit [Bacteroidota bacterium]